MSAKIGSGSPTDVRYPEVVAWRRSQLLAAGFPPGLADRLAYNCGVELHALVDLVQRGCPPALAARILAPLEHESRSC